MHHQLAHIETTLDTWQYTVNTTERLKNSTNEHYHIKKKTYLNSQITSIAFKQQQLLDVTETEESITHRPHSPVSHRLVHTPCH